MIFILLFIIGFIVIFGGIVTAIILVAVKMVKQKKTNDTSPVLTYDVRIAGKKINHWAGAFDNVPSDSYSVTFEFKNGATQEYDLFPNVYYSLEEGDCGQLKLQGTRFVGFTKA